MSFPFERFFTTKGHKESQRFYDFSATLAVRGKQNSSESIFLFKILSEEEFVGAQKE